ncbi:hypothetical protein XELAEV_18021540mg [Xenopus laevis]|uniref:Uncharacterized protein n=1 Tax=Xenopus laevis TaxID=8355 RepID=A0A974DBE4_XENLA|nr:hypothetical protein XELAEV_18021540mg [Xenopus laevis]
MAFPSVSHIPRTCQLCGCSYLYVSHNVNRCINSVSLQKQFFLKKKAKKGQCSKYIKMCVCCRPGCFSMYGIPFFFISMHVDTILRHGSFNLAEDIYSQACLSRMGCHLGVEPAGANISTTRVFYCIIHLIERRHGRFLNGKISGTCPGIEGLGGLWINELQTWLRSTYRNDE